MCVRRILAAFCGLAALAGCGNSENATRPLPQEAYVWQRAWTPPVIDAVRTEAESFAGLHLLAAEVAWTGEDPVVTRPVPPLATLAEFPAPVSPVLRLGPFTGTFDRNDNTSRFLCDLALSVMEEWRAAGVRPAELQIDFDEAGQFSRLAAEGFLPESLAADPAAVVRLAADPNEMAGLVREWTRKPPENLAGLLWFRLPTAEDHWNWPIETLRAVREGRSPESRLQVRAEKDENGLIRIIIQNTGETEETLPGTVHTRLSPTQLLAGDGFNGFVWSDSNPLSLKRSHPTRTLRPGESRPIAWLRLADDTDPQTILANDLVP